MSRSSYQARTAAAQHCRRGSSGLQDRWWNYRCPDHRHFRSSILHCTTDTMKISHSAETHQVRTQWAPLNLVGTSSLRHTPLVHPFRSSGSNIRRYRCRTHSVECLFERTPDHKEWVTQYCLDSSARPCSPREQITLVNCSSSQQDNQDIRWCHCSLHICPRRTATAPMTREDMYCLRGTEGHQRRMGSPYLQDRSIPEGTDVLQTRCH